MSNGRTILFLVLSITIILETQSSWGNNYFNFPHAPELHSIRFLPDNPHRGHGDRGVVYRTVDHRDSYGERSMSPTNTNAAPRSICHGVCLHASQCASMGGTSTSICSIANSVCCEFENSCSTVTDKDVSYFKSPGYPAPTLGNLVCHYDVLITPGVCVIKLEFLEFNTTGPLDRGLCHVDQLLIINSLDGATFPRCGELTGYSTIVPVDARHKLPLSLLSIIQSSREQYKWDIRVTQVKCGAASVKEYTGCGNNSILEPELSPTKGIVEETTTVSSHQNDIVLFDDSSTDQIFYSASGDSDSRQNVDNAFYIAYLKKAFDIMSNTSSTGSEGNRSLCKDLYKESEPRLDIDDMEFEEFGRIIRGNEALVHEFPWQVSIQDEKGHICGGAIISPLLLLTAAHCYMSVAPIPLSSLQVVVGDLNFNTTDEGKEEKVEVQDVVFHSHFDPYYLQNDIALIRLKKPLTFRAGVQPVCLPERGNSYTGQSAVISGWGATSYPHGKLATTLQKSKNRIIENSECEKKLKIDYLYDTMICAVAPNCSGTCFGDSGGPLIIKRGDGRQTLIGLVSFGIGGCAPFPFWPDVYARVSAYLNWLSFASL